MKPTPMVVALWLLWGITMALAVYQTHLIRTYSAMTTRAQIQTETAVKGWERANVTLEECVAVAKAFKAEIK